MSRKKTGQSSDQAAEDTRSAALDQEVAPPADPRSRARWVAVQALYEWDASGHDALEAVNNRLDDVPDAKRVGEMARLLAGGVRANQEAIDAVLGQAAPQWSVQDMSVVDRNILRVAVYEVLFDTKTPVRAALNEAVELAKTFGAETSPRFVNGVLGAVAQMATRS